MEPSKIFLASLIFMLILLISGCESNTQSESIMCQNNDNSLPLDTQSIEQSNYNLVQDTNEEIVVVHNPSNAENEPKDYVEVSNPIYKQQEPKTQSQEVQVVWEDSSPKQEKLLMFHNGNGPMCLEQLEFFDQQVLCNNLKFEEYLTTTTSGRSLMEDTKKIYGKSYGVSKIFGYLPITFINGHAYSGFNEDIKERLIEDIEVVCG